MKPKRFFEYERAERAINASIAGVVEDIKMCDSSERKRELRKQIDQLNAERYMLDERYPECKNLIRIAT